MIVSKVSRTSLIVFLGLLTGLLILSVRIIQPYLLSLVMGAILAILCWPIYVRLRGKKKHSNFASIMVTLSLVMAIMIPTLLMIFLSVQEGLAMSKALSENGQFSFQHLIDEIARVPLVKGAMPDRIAAEKQIRSSIQSVGEAGTSLILDWVSPVPSFFVQFILTALSCCFFLLDGKRFYHWVTQRIPMDKTISKHLVVAFKDTSVSVIWATFCASMAQSTIIFFSFLALNVSGSFLAAGVTFICAWIPMVGSSPVWATAAVYLWVKGETLKVVLMVVFGLSTGVADNTIRAVILKGRSQLHPLVSLVAIFGGIQMYGLLGVFLGPIVAAVLMSLLDVWPKVGQRYGLMKTPEGELLSHSRVHADHSAIQSKLD